MSTERTLAEMERQTYEGRVDHLVERLEGIIRDVKSTAVHATGSVDGTPRWAAHADRLIHHVMWGIANANLNGLASAAARVDRAEQEPI